jgi:hypothetical protein
MQQLPQTYWIFKQVMGGRATYEDFVRRLKRFSRSELLRVCSVFNIVLMQWTDGYDVEYHARLVRTCFSPSLAATLLALPKPVFHRHQLLFVAQEALRHCNDEEKAAVVKPPWNRIGILMLIASELLAVPKPTGASPSEELARKISSVLPDMETNGPSSYHRKMARTLAMCTRFTDQLRGTTNFFDIHKLFRDANGVELETFYALLFGCFSRFMNLKEIKDSTNLSDFAVAPAFFRTCRAITPDELKNFFEYVSADAAAYALEVRDKKPHRNEFTVLRNRPLFADNGLYRPLDLSLLAEKMESGVFWSANGKVPPDRREQFHQFWGQVFERYARWLIEASVDGKINKVYPDVRYAERPDDQVCDALVMSGRVAVLIECKGSTFTANGKYGGDPKVLDLELQSKLIGTPKRRKGVRQLVEAIENLFVKNPPDSISGIEMAEVDAVFPVVLTRDDIGSAYNVSTYLNLHFQELIKDRQTRCPILPLCSISADDVERLTPYLTEVSLGDILSARVAGDSRLVFPLWYGENKILDGLEERPATLLNADIQKLEDLCKKHLGLADDGTA